MENLELFGVPLMALISAIVEVLKRVGLPSQFAPYAVAVLSVVAVWMVGYVATAPPNLAEVEFWFNLVVYTLGSIGLYSGAKWAAQTKAGFRVKRKFEIAGE